MRPQSFQNGDFMTEIGYYNLVFVYRFDDRDYIKWKVAGSHFMIHKALLDDSPYQLITDIFREPVASAPPRNDFRDPSA